MYIKDYKLITESQPKKYSPSEAGKILRSYKIIDSKGRITEKYSNILVKVK